MSNCRPPGGSAPRAAEIGYTGKQEAGDSTRSDDVSELVQSPPLSYRSTAERMEASEPCNAHTQPSKLGKLFKYPDFSSCVRLITGGKRMTSACGSRWRVMYCSRRSTRSTYNAVRAETPSTPMGLQS